MEYSIREVNMVEDGMNDCINELDMIKTEDMFEEDYGSGDMQCYNDNLSTDTGDYEAHTLANNGLDMNNQRCLKRKYPDDNRNVMRCSNTTYQPQQQQRMIFPHTGEAQQEDLELLTLLSQWKLERIYKHLLEQGISLYILRIMKSNHIEKLCKDFNVGTMAYFEHCLHNWRNSNIPLTINCEPTAMAIPVPPTNTTLQTPAGYTNLASILKSSKYGTMLLRFYDEHKGFREEDRTRLISLIAQYYDQNDIHLSLPLSHKIEQEVIDMFPTEKLEFYRTAKRGRLYNKYCNLKSSIRNLKINSNTEIKNPIETEEATLFPEKNAEIAMSHLRHTQLSTVEFENYWRECSNYRISDIRKNSLIEIFQKWPQYTCISKAYRLIDMDFSVLYPNKKSIIEKWQEVEDALCTILDNERSIRKKSVRDALSNITKTSKNGKAATLMWASHAFLVPWQKEVSKDSTGKKFFTRFTISDSQDSFLVLCANKKDIEEHIKCRDLNSAPIIMAISSDISIINEVYVVFANSKYAFENFIEAVDMCFKIFMLFNINFPKASMNFWNFIQNFFYEIKTKEKFGKVSILMMEITKKMYQIPCSNVI